MHQMSIDLTNWYVEKTLAKGYHLVDEAGSHVQGSPAWFPSENAAIQWASQHGVGPKKRDRRPPMVVMELEMCTHLLHSALAD